MNELVLQVLRQMATDYKKVIEVKENQSIHLHETNTCFGFCFYLDKAINIGDSLERRVLYQLKQDLENEDYLNYSKRVHWYPTAMDFKTAFEVEKFCLQTRLDHINRTIARIEKQLN